MKNILIKILSGFIFVSALYCFIALHDLAGVKEPLFNIKKDFHVENQDVIDYTLPLTRPTFLKVRVKFESGEKMPLKSLVVNGRDFSYKKMRKKGDDLFFYEFWIPEEIIGKDNNFSVRLRKPLSGTFKINL